MFYEENYCTGVQDLVGKFLFFFLPEDTELTSLSFPHQANLIQYVTVTVQSWLQMYTPLYTH